MIVDFDDLWDQNHRIDLFVRLKEANPLFKATVFAIPGLCTQPFLDSLPDWLEVAGHGWKHPHPQEASTWTKERMEEVMDAMPSGFVNGWKSPGWQISDGTYEALTEAGWWVADQPYNDSRRPPGLLTHRLGDGDHWHGHVGNVCGNGIEETFPELLGRVTEATEFQFISEAVIPWMPV